MLHDRNPTFVRLSDGSVRNGYTLKVMNHAPQPRTLVLTVEDVTGAMLNVIGVGVGHEIAIPVEADKVHPLRVLVKIPRGHIHSRSMDMEFALFDPKTGEKREVETVFLSGDE